MKWLYCWLIGCLSLNTCSPHRMEFITMTELFITLWKENPARCKASVYTFQEQKERKQTSEYIFYASLTMVDEREKRKRCRAFSLVRMQWFSFCLYLFSQSVSHSFIHIWRSLFVSLALFVYVLRECECVRAVYEWCLFMVFAFKNIQNLLHYEM